MKGAYSLPAEFRGILEECAVRAMDEDIEGLPEWERFRVISDEIGIFLYILARSTNRTKIIEISGQGGAASTLIWLAGAARETGGEVLGWETNPRRWVKLQNSLSRSRLAPNVKLRTSDPLWPSEERGSVIAPPIPEDLDDAEMDICLDELNISFDMVVISMCERDWPQRLLKGWDLLDPGGLLVLTETIHVAEAAEKMLSEFFRHRAAAVSGFQLAEGIVLAYKVSDEKSKENPLHDSDLTGERAHLVLAGLADENRKPGSRLWAIPPVTGKLLWILITATSARNVLEIGASAGYSGTWIATAFDNTGGNLTTVEMDPEKVLRARDTYEKAGVSDRVEIIDGDALEIIPTLSEQYDFIFLDCDKQYYQQLLEPILWRLRRGGLLMADNAISHADDMKQYLDEVRNHSCLASVTIPVGSGEELTMVI